MGDPEHVTLVPETGQGESFRLVSLPPKTAPSKLPAPPELSSLLVAPTMTSAVADAAVKFGWSIVTDDGRVCLRFANSIVTSLPAAPSSPQRRRSAWSLFAVARVLAVPATGAKPLRQADVAAAAGVSQPSVSRTLKKLHAIRTRSWDPREPDSLGSWWHENYPSAGGTSSYWFALDDTMRQAARVALQVEKENATAREGAAPHPPRRVAFSGDVAADLLAPWQRPNKALVYVDGPVDLAAAGFIPASNREQATLEVISPRDRSIWLPTPWLLPSLGAGAELADPVQVLYDLTRDKTPTGNEAAQRLVRYFVDTGAERWRASRLSGAVPESASKFEGLLHG